MQALLIAGPSGAGKSTLRQLLTAEGNFRKIVTNTTRAPREGEIPGLDYYFQTEEEYLNLLNSGDFFMSNFFHNSYYGTLTSEVERIIAEGFHPVMETFIPTIPQFKAKFPDTKAIYLYPDNLELLVERMQMRGDTQEQIQKRMQATKEELAYFHSEGHHYIDFVTLLGEKTSAELFSEVVNIMDGNTEFKVK